VETTADTPLAQPGIVGELQARFPDVPLVEQRTADEIPTVWVPATRLKELLAYLKTEAARPFASLYDLGGIDERLRAHRAGQPDADFTVFYHLLSYERNADLRLKVALRDDDPAVETITDLWPAANWYERELWDMFGIDVRGHPRLARILLPLVGRASLAQRSALAGHGARTLHHAA